MAGELVVGEPLLPLAVLLRTTNERGYFLGIKSPRKRTTNERGYFLGIN